MGAAPGRGRSRRVRSFDSVEGIFLFYHEEGPGPEAWDGSHRDGSSGGRVFHRRCIQIHCSG